jgi:hypothetical protein
LTPAPIAREHLVIMTTTIAPLPSSSEDRKVVDAAFDCAWLSWVGAARGCLNALGVECDKADVAGQSGYAFRIQVHAQLCPSGPTMFPWDSLLMGVRRLGRSTLVFTGSECHSGKWKNERTRAHCAAAFNLARREIDAGRPCVIWGAYIPECAVCNGYEGESYLVDSFKKCHNEPQPPMRFDELDAPGGLYVLAFPTATRMPQESADRDAIWDAINAMSWKMIEEDWSSGAAAYDRWAASLRERPDVIPFGNAYNAQCWAEARRLAERYVDRVATRNPHVSGLRRAHAALKRSADALQRVGEIFPFPGKADDLNEKNRREATDVLAAARAADVDALAALETAMQTWKRPKRAPGDA